MSGRLPVGVARTTNFFSADEFGIKEILLVTEWSYPSPLERQPPFDSFPWDGRWDQAEYWRWGGQLFSSISSILVETNLDAPLNQGVRPTRRGVGLPPTSTCCTKNKYTLINLSHQFFIVCHHFGWIIIKIKLFHRAIVHYPLINIYKNAIAIHYL